MMVGYVMNNLHTFYPCNPRLLVDFWFFFLFFNVQWEFLRIFYQSGWKLTSKGSIPEILALFFPSFSLNRFSRKIRLADGDRQGSSVADSFTVWNFHTFSLFVVPNPQWASNRGDDERVFYAFLFIFLCTVFRRLMKNDFSFLFVCMGVFVTCQMHLIE